MTKCAPTLDSAGQEYLGKVIDSAAHMRDLLCDLLQFSRTAETSERLGRVELNALASEAAKVFESSSDESDFRIEIENLPAIEADSGQMTLLFEKLIENVLKFRSDEIPHIKIYGKSDTAEMCEIFIEDNGIGFEQQYATLIFKPFQRLNKRKYSGTGMGLALCRKIVERHGGTIRAESEPGKGATFVICLPVRQVKFGRNIPEHE